jgi:hypothetical protein
LIGRRLDYERIHNSNRLSSHAGLYLLFFLRLILYYLHNIGISLGFHPFFWLLLGYVAIHLGGGMTLLSPNSGCVLRGSLRSLCC